MQRSTTRLRELIARGPTLYVPGCYNAMSARVLEAAGFEAIYMTGYGTSLSLTGLPDVGLTTGTEMAMNARYIASAVRVPLIADADTGFGNAINVIRTVREYIGAGVAGLQAIATAKRLGAVVEAYDVRAATKEQVQSLGARFIELAMETGDAETKGGYAKEQTDEQRRKQSALMSRHVIGADVVVATAAVFGKAPPMLIPKDVVEQMRPGSVIVDMAASKEHGRAWNV